jgi:hypothetical protein
MKRTDLKTIKGRGEPADNVYVNMSIINNGTEDLPSEKYPICELSEVSSSSIIEDTGQYDLAVVKFSMDGITQFLPCFHFMTQEGETNKGIYSITLTCEKDGTTYEHQQYVTYTPQNSNFQSPGENNKSSEYYDCFSVNYVLQLFNTAIITAKNNINQQITANNKTPNSDVQTPFLYFNPTTNLISMKVGYEGWGDLNTSSGNDEEDWEIYFNQNTYNVFKTFPYDIANQSDGKEFRILLGKVDYDPYSNETEYTLSQEFASLGSYWSPVESLVLINNGGDMNINQTYQSTPVRLNTHSYGKKGVTENYTENIITEFSIDKANPQAWTENLLYTPENYRFYSLMSDGHIKHIKLQWFYRQRLTGELREIRMPNQSSCHLSLLFKRKG